MSNPSRPVVIAGNWKMHKDRQEGRELAQAIVEGVKGQADSPKVILCPPYTTIESVIEVVSGQPIEVGAQNLDYRDSGAFTGEVSAPMLKELGVTHVLIGHSERRQFFGETNTTVNLRLKAALRHQLIPIVCVGETNDERESSLTDAVISRQVVAALADLVPGQLDSLVIAYEPVWAIGTGKVCEAEEANRVSKLIRLAITNYYNDKARAVTIPVLYGGSVKPSNIDEILAQSDVDGALVGGASLKAEDFLPLIQAGSKRIKLMLSKA